MIRDGKVIAGNPITLKIDSISSSISLSNFVDSLKIIKLGGPESLLFSESENQKIISITDKLIVFDDKYMSIKVFDTSGKYLNSIGKLGAEKGAFIRAEDIQYYPPHQSVVVLCNKPTKICEFSLSGHLIRDTIVNFFASSFVIPTPNTRIFFVNQNKSKISKDKNILITDSNYNVKSRFFDLPKNISSTFKFSGGLFLVNKEVYFTPVFSNTYYLIKGDTARPAFQVDYGKKNIPSNIREDSILFNLTKYCFQYSTFVKNDSYIGFNYLNKNECMFFYNLHSGKIILGDKKADSLNLLFSGYTFSFQDKKYATVLNGKKISEFVKRNASLVQKKFPFLYKQLSELKSDENPTILIYSLK